MLEKPEQRILITGSRDWSGPLIVSREITRYIGENAPSTDSNGFPVDWDAQGWVIVHGDCPTGADAWADEYAITHMIEVERHPADWRTYGKKAGALRNNELVDAGADVCLGFINPCTNERCTRPHPHGSHGTVDCLRKASQMQMEIRLFTEDDPDAWWFQRLRKEYT